MQKSMLSVFTALLVVLVLTEVEGGSRAASETTDSVVIHHHEETPTTLLPETCPPWFIPKTVNGSVVCECGSSLNGVLGELVKCDAKKQAVQLSRYFCMTYNDHDSSTVVGGCLIGDVQQMNYYYPIPNTTAALKQMCMKFRANRKGQLCGQCAGGFAPPVYSYLLNCVNCSGNNWLKYVAVSLLPLTIFCILIIILRVSVTSSLLNGFVLFAQLITTPIVLRIVLSGFLLSPGKFPQILSLIKVYTSLLGVWNLDFFRADYHPFCLHPNTTTLQILALDYIVAAYPLLLTGVVFMLVKLRDCNFRVIVLLWKPFHWCLSRFRRRWDIQTTLIDAFATFLLLSFVKFLKVSADLLIPTQVCDIHGSDLGRFLFYDGSIEYFGTEHLPYALLAIGVLFLFIILPLLLLCLYPCRCFQRCLNQCGARCNTLHIFMDSFQGCYKNGTSGTHDCRFFAAVYLTVRIAIFALYSCTVGNYFFILTTLALIVVVALLVIFQPHKSRVANTVDTLLLLVLVLLIASLSTVSTTATNVGSYSVPAVLLGIAVIFFFATIPLVYIISLVMHQVCKRWMLPLIHRSLYLRERHQRMEEVHGGYGPIGGEPESAVERDNWPQVAPYRQMDQLREPLLESKEN